MADPSMYYAMGQGTPEDPSNPRSQHPPQYPAGGFSPAGAPPQPGAAYPNASPNQWPAYGSPQQQYPGASPDPNLAYNAAPQQPMADPNMAGLASQMSGLGIATDAGARPHRKKHRHAHHDIGAAPGAPPPSFNNPMAAGGGQPTSQFLNTGLNQAPRPISPMAGPQPGQPVPGMGAQPGFASGGSAVPTQGKVDPEQIPSIPRSRDVPAQFYFNHVYPTMDRQLPPPASIPFVAHDQGNSSPKYARLTLNSIPATSDFLASTGLPLGMVLQPLAPLDPGEQPIPVLDFGDTGPPRCRRCRAYINPFMSFRAGGSKFVCNMCTFPNDTPTEYYAPLEPNGARVDRMQRPELMMGTVEFLVPKEYWNKEPVGLQTLFLIDVSRESVHRGFLKGVCEGIAEALYGEDGAADGTEGDESTSRRIPAGSKIGIVTFDREVQFYNLTVREPHSLSAPFVLTDANYRQRWTRHRWW